MKEQVPDSIKKARNEALRVLGLKKNMEFRSRFKDRTLHVVLEGGGRPEDGGYSGLTDNYLRVRVSGAGREHIGKEIPVLIKDVDKFELIGEHRANLLNSLR
jgi:tRNA A37 methylthiotransferase MiaB